MRHGSTLVVTLSLVFWAVFIFLVVPILVPQKAKTDEFPTQMICGLSADTATALRKGNHNLTGCPEIIRDLGAPERT